mmetsp:Transcript_54342/g.119183  ORF Transcript_54342/g.119183 Transcript_54342/m.119183 type:complete len:190 (+) Transcript_54342:64-633(+)|eukprot:CAMPEP_0204271256 /NCGR_PEP_ID=MMETSP0468-20130131/19351_1 /ASSEMBLY_ACC=CAM_ASM_000383 /TAXON_ID=2969 /ORGANISM="Oxyrrhis marina" /LENGTH=189 /DNA_ID=CAMNT_0051246883 /DNA_START=60 /DNA_END=629 /DNA_ORIENTATION=+
MRVLDVGVLCCLASASSSSSSFLKADDPNYTSLFGDYFPISLTVGNETIEARAQVAIRDQEQHQGLMYRTALPENSGMYFMYTTDEKRVLYMRNTKIPLDAGWFSADGVLHEVMHLKPMDESWVWTQATNMRFGLEMEAGWFAKHGADPAAPGYACGNSDGCVRVDTQALAKALQTKGYSSACGTYLSC